MKSDAGGTTGQSFFGARHNPLPKVIGNFSRVFHSVAESCHGAANVDHRLEALKYVVGADKLGYKIIYSVNIFQSRVL